MKQAISLEEEKRRLLEQLENSRAVYRRMLMDEEEPLYEEIPPAAYHHAAPLPEKPFPQSKTLRWAMAHPYLLTAGVIVLMAAGRKGWARSRDKQQEKISSQPDEDSDIRKGIAATTLGTTLATTIAMMLRNPAQLQAAMRAATLAVNYYKSRRGNPRQRFE